jgi:hypothetical protein
MANDYIKTNYDEPILFRTLKDKDVYENTKEKGSLWLRTGEYYQQLEDKIRSDKLEGVSAANPTFQLAIKTENNVEFNIICDESSTLSQTNIPHYIISLHGTNISKEQHTDFGAMTLGIKSLSSLMKEVVAEVSKSVDVIKCSYGPVKYQYAALKLSRSSQGSNIELSETPPMHLKIFNSDTLRKRPIEPFISQDEWRIVVFIKSYYKDDPELALKINVRASNFYPYNIEKI